MPRLKGCAMKRLRPSPGRPSPGRRVPSPCSPPSGPSASSPAPRAPGARLPLGLRGSHLPSPAPLPFVAVLVLFIPAAWGICRACERTGLLEEDSDPSWIVIDEAAGLGVALLPFAFAPSPAAAVFAFVLFRAFDAAKPPSSRTPSAPPVQWASSWMTSSPERSPLSACGCSPPLLAAFALPA